MRILVKIGGAQLEQRGPRERLCRALRAARDAGHEVVVVHGGGNQIRELGRRLALPERYHDGLRVTDADMATVVLMVLGGRVNRMLTATLLRAGVPAVGLSGADGGLFTVRRLERPGVDLGFVGEVDRVDRAIVDALLAAGQLPVIATVAPATTPASGDADEPFYNVNADHAAGPLCRALGCDALLFLTDVPGVRGRSGAVAAALTPADCDDLVRDGTASGGMLPKLEAARMALRDNPTALIKIAPADGEAAVLQALSRDCGTRFLERHDDHDASRAAREA